MICLEQTIHLTLNVVGRGRGCIYYESFLSLKVIDIQCLQEYNNFKTRIGEKLCNTIILYCSLSQSQDDFGTFLKIFELIFDIILANNSFLTVVPGDVNVKSNISCLRDKKSLEGSKTNCVTSEFGLQK